MQSPARLLEAAKPGPPLNEKEKEKFVRSLDPKFKSGFNGTHKLPEDYASHMPRVIYTPSTWRRVGIHRIGKDYALLQLISCVAFTATDLRLLGLSEDLQTLALSIEEALQNGETIEKAYSQKK